MSVGMPWDGLLGDRTEVFSVVSPAFPTLRVDRPHAPGSPFQALRRLDKTVMYFNVERRADATVSLFAAEPKPFWGVIKA